MQLHSGPLYWPHTAANPQYPVLNESASCELLIIGGGMTGAILAYIASGLGIDTILLEKAQMGSGSTSANTGLLQYCSDKQLSSCIHSFGEDNGVQFYQQCLNAVKGIKDIAGKLKEDVQFRDRNSLYFASTAEDVPKLREEYDTLNRYGFPVYWLTKEEIEGRFPFSKENAIYTEGDAEINPYRFVHALLQSAGEKGARLYASSPVTGFDLKASDGIICRSGTHTIHANHVILATGYQQLLRKARGSYNAQSFALVTEPVPFLDKWHERCLIWETARPYLYLRTTPENRIIIGGLDERLGPGGLEQTRYIRKSDLLLEQLAALFPDAKGVKAEYCWGAVFGQSHDGLPFIGRHPDHPNCWIVENYGGNGTVYSYIAAMLTMKAIKGEEVPELELFSLSRNRSNFN